MEPSSEARRGGGGVTTMHPPPSEKSSAAMWPRKQRFLERKQQRVTRRQNAVTSAACFKQKIQQRKQAFDFEALPEEESVTDENEPNRNQPARVPTNNPIPHSPEVEKKKIIQATTPSKSPGSRRRETLLVELKQSLTAYFNNTGAHAKRDDPRHTRERVGMLNELKEQLTAYFVGDAFAYHGVGLGGRRRPRQLTQQQLDQQKHRGQMNNVMQELRGISMLGSYYSAPVSQREAESMTEDTEEETTTGCSSHDESSLQGCLRIPAKKTPQHQPSPQATESPVDEKSVWTEYTEYTVDDETVADDDSTAAPPSAALHHPFEASLARQTLPSVCSSVDDEDYDDQSTVYSEYTIEEASVGPLVAAVRSLRTKNLAKARSAGGNRRTLGNFFHEAAAASLAERRSLHSTPRDDMSDSSSSDESSADEEEEERPTITVYHELDDDCCTEVTDDEFFAKRSLPMLGLAPAAEKSGAADDDEFTEFTLEETVASSKRGFQLLAVGYQPLTKGLGNQTASTQCSDEDEEELSSHGPSQDPSNNSTVTSAASRRSNNTQIAELLRKDVWSRDANTVQIALKQLATEAASDEHARASIARLGGLLAMVRAMESHSDHADVQVQGCLSLQQLGRDYENQVALCDVGGMSAVIQAMESHPDNQDVQEAACSALARLTQNGHGATLEDDSPQGAVQGLVAALMSSSRPRTLESAFSALSNLCVDHAGRFRELQAAGGLVAMTTALSRPWDNDSARQEAISLLSIMLRNV